MKTGIYQIKNSVTGAVYIGSTSYNFSTRWRTHRSQLRRQAHGNKHLQSSWNKHGENAFEFTVLEECEPNACIHFEQWWIDCEAPTFNKCKTAGSTRGRKHSVEARLKMAEKARNRSADIRARVSAALRGRHVSDATRARMSASAKQRRAGAAA